MYIDPKRPKTAHQRMKRITSQAKRIATVVYAIRMGRIMNIRAVTAEKEPTTVAKTWKARCEQPGVLINTFRTTYPFPIAIFVLFSCFVKVLRVQANDCEGEDKLQKSKHEVDNVCNGQARAAVISEGHLAFCEDFRGDAVGREGSSRIWSLQLASRSGSSTAAASS
jgi:hypothetical protein